MMITIHHSAFIKEKIINPNDQDSKIKIFCQKIFDNKLHLQSLSMETFFDKKIQKKRNILSIIMNDRLYRISLDNIEYKVGKHFHTAKLNLSFVNVDGDGDNPFNPKWYNVNDFKLNNDDQIINYRLKLLNHFNYNGQKYWHYFFQTNSSTTKSTLVVDGKIQTISNKPGYFPFFHNNDHIYHSIDHGNADDHGGRMNPKPFKSPGYFLFKSKQSGQNIIRIQSIYLNKNYGKCCEKVVYQ